MTTTYCPTSQYTPISRRHFRISSVLCIRQTSLGQHFRRVSQLMANFHPGCCPADPRARKLRDSKSLAPANKSASHCAADVCGLVCDTAPPLTARCGVNIESLRFVDEFASSTCHDALPVCRSAVASLLSRHFWHVRWTACALVIRPPRHLSPL